MGTGLSIVWMPGEVRTEIHLVGEETGGAFCMLVDHPPPGWRLPPHRHRDEDETIHILEGSFDLDVDGSSFHLDAGDTLHIPRGVPHSGANVGPETGRRVIIFSPAGIEGFFEHVGQAKPEEVDRATARAIAARHGWDFVAAEP